MDWTLLEDAETVARTACGRILAAARDAIAERGRFSLVLAGGRTPARTYQLLAQEASDWAHWHLYFGDERCLPPDHPERNSLLAEQHLSAQVPIPGAQIHRIPAELGAGLTARSAGRADSSAATGSRAAFRIVSNITTNPVSLVGSTSALLEFYQKYDIHIHVPEGATPKDGPSAGVGMCTALVSALTKIPVRADVAMTGEITLRGKVLPIGGLKEKLLAAHRGGIKLVLIPDENEKDLVDIPKAILRKIEVKPVSTIDEVLELALVEMPEPLPAVVEPKPAEGEKAADSLITH